VVKKRRSQTDSPLPNVHPVPPDLPELTLRGLVLGALITIVFTAANVFLGLKVGLTFASSIPAAVISMAVLRALDGARPAGGAHQGGLLENNMVQTQASAAGTLSSIIFVLPALLMVGHWQDFPYWQSAGVCIAGGVLGVLFTIPLRRAMVVGSDLPYPEGVAAAEILRVGAGASAAGGVIAEPGAADIAAGGVIAAIFCLASSGLHLLGESISVWLSAGAAVFRLSTGFSLALLGAGYLIGLASGLAMLLGAVISWGISVPMLTWLHPAPAGADIAAYATMVWATKVRFIGAGVIGVAAIWALAGLAGPTLAGVRSALGRIDLGGGAPARTDQDLSPRTAGGLFVFSVVVMAAVFIAFAAATPALAAYGTLTLALISVVFAAVLGFVVAAACGYMAGLVGSSSSPISGIAILATIAASLLLLLLFAGRLGDAGMRQAAIALVLITVSVVLATATISNDNLQDLKTGYLLGATPWRQQAALVVGVVVGGLVIPPILNLLHTAYGFPGAVPRPGMDPAQILAAPQATLMARIATGILGGTLEWAFIGIGAGISVLLLVVDAVLRRVTAQGRLPVLAVGIGLYLPPTVGVTLGIGAVLGWFVERGLRGRADEAAAKRRGVLIASGFIVGESLVGVALAAVIGATGNQSALSVVGPGFEAVSQWIALAAFMAVAVWLARRVRA
jgi:putative OPT family oligopeptide transporter